MPDTDTYRSLVKKLALLAVATLCSLLLVNLSLLGHLPYWFWRMHQKHLPCWWLVVPMCFLLSGCVLLIAKRAMNPLIMLLLLIIVGAVLQHGFALMEGRGSNGIRDRILYPGHSQFAKDAIKQDSMLQVVEKYPDMLQTGELAHYPYATKPPGQLLFYMGTERLSRVLPCKSTTRLDCLADLASLLWPVMCSATVIPLYFLSLLYLGRQRAYIPCIVYISMPSVVLITLHLDQCLYPALAVSSIALVAYGTRMQKPVLQLCAGIVTGLATFVSYSLIVLIPFAMLLVLASSMQHPLSSRLKHRENYGQLLARATPHLLCYFFGIALCCGIQYAAFDYNSLTSYRFSMSAHQNWKIKEWTLDTIAYIGLLDLLEFAVWSGMAAVFLAVVAMLKACTWRLPSGRSSTQVILFVTFFLFIAIAYSGFYDPLKFAIWCGIAFVFVAVAATLTSYTWRLPSIRTSTQVLLPFTVLLFMLAFFGRTTAETARLWLFLVPFVALLASVGLTVSFGRHTWLAVGAVSILQILNTFGIKLWQDFY